MDQGSKPFALIYRIYYRLLGTQFNPGAMINREPAGKTMLIQCSTPDARVPISKMIQWQDVKLPTEWLLEQEASLAKSTTNKWSNNTYTIDRWNYMSSSVERKNKGKDIYIKRILVFP